MKIPSIGRCSSFTRTCIPLIAFLFTAGCASLPVAEHAEGREITINIPARTTMVFSRADAVESVRDYAKSLHIPSSMESQVTGIIENNFNQQPETARPEITATVNNRQPFCITLESVLNKLLVPDQLYTHKTSWSHSMIKPTTRGGSTVTTCQGAGPIPTSAILTVRFVKEWDWRRQITGGYCAACYADSFIELTLPIRIERVRQAATEGEQIQMTFRLNSVKSKDPTVLLGQTVADTHFDLDGFFSALGQIPKTYPRKDLEPENPYRWALSQAKLDLATLADKWQRKIARDATAAERMSADKVSAEKKTAKEATLARWRNTIKIGVEGWVGPIDFGLPASNLMMHALVVDRRGELVRVQYDGKTDHNIIVSLREKEAWVKIKAFYPESEFTAGSPSSIFTPNGMPIVQ